jgi:nucleotide-binding universal stress UspA family protein
MSLKLFRRVLVPHDFSSHADGALKTAAELAQRDGGRLLVLHVIAPFYGPPPLADGGAAFLGPAALVPEQLEALKTHTARLLGRGAPPYACRVEVGDPAQQMVDAARAVDCIVMATHGRTGLMHLLVGSVAERAVRLSSVPVLIIRASKPRASTSRRGGTRSRGRAAER